MAIRTQDLELERADAVVVRFPTELARARAARARRVAARRRGWLAIAAAVVVAAGVATGARAPATPATPSAGPRAVVVAPGDTLWDVAERHAPAGTDPRAFVDELVELNALDGAPAAGVRLRLPR
ncbi:MAG TPA: LysM domain-containing protein [Actinomycetota bacterium]|nr:LysM domain-containing protein [Actinomycetota bacterium]